MEARDKIVGATVGFIIGEVQQFVAVAGPVDKVFVKAGEESESIVFIVERWIEGNCMGSIR